MKIVKTIAVICLGLLTPLGIFLVKTRTASPLFLFSAIGIGLILLIASVALFIDKIAFEKKRNEEVI